jgi:hypothetical protein
MSRRPRKAKPKARSRPLWRPPSRCSPPEPRALPTSSPNGWERLIGTSSTATVPGCIGRSGGCNGAGRTPSERNRSSPASGRDPVAPAPSEGSSGEAGITPQRLLIVQRVAERLPHRALGQHFRTLRQ